MLLRKNEKIRLLRLVTKPDNPKTHSKKRRLVFDGHKYQWIGNIKFMSEVLNYGLISYKNFYAAQDEICSTLYFYTSNLKASY